MKLLIITQVHENYGAHDWDGNGQCPQYWKAKGGCDYVVKDFKADGDKSFFETAFAVVETLKHQIESSNEYYREYIIEWEVVGDDYLTAFERDQLEYDGKITYPAKELTL